MYQWCNYWVKPSSAVLHIFPWDLSWASVFRHLTSDVLSSRPAVTMFVSSSRWSQQRWTRDFSQTATAKFAALSSSPSPSGSPIMRWGHPLTWPPTTFHTLSDWMRGSWPPERLHGSQHLSPAADSHTAHLSGTTYLFHQTLMIETEEQYQQRLKFVLR